MRSKLIDFLAKNWLSFAFCLITAILFKPTWWDGLLFGFRDTLHFYYPLWSYISRLPFSDQILPLWNPLDGFGCSIVGEPTSMVFYPIRVILLLPVGNIEQRIGGFLLIHVWLSYAMWIYSGSKLGLQSAALQLTGWAYALSGPVFFQIYNPPFLVGSAWLPLAMFGLLKITNVRLSESEHTVVLLNLRASLQNSRHAISCLTLSLAMIVFGGDAQLAYHLAIVGGLVACIFLCQVRWNAQASTTDCVRQFLFSTFSILIAFSLAVGLTSIQSIPTRYWLEISERAFPVDVGSDVNVRNFLGAPYVYSEAPWNYLTVLVSNVLGHVTPTNTRWLIPFGAESSIWSPSLHVGTLVLASAFAWWFVRLRDSLSLVTLLIAMLAVLSSLGRYNLYDVWIAILPGYGQFRFPAKWTPLFAWGICMAATEGIGHIRELKIRNVVQKLCLLVACLGSIAASVNLVVYFSPQVRQSLFDLVARSAKSRSIEFDLDLSQAIYFIGFGGFLTAFASFSIYTILRNNHSKRAVIAIGVISIVELTLALQPALIFVRPVSVDPLPGWQAESNTLWRHFTDDSTTRESKGKLAKRGITATWEFGEMNLPVLRSQDRLIARDVAWASDNTENHAAYQGDHIMGKLQLLRNFRSFQSYYTLEPRILRRLCTIPTVDPEDDAALKSVESDDYFLHHLSPITEIPTWPPIEALHRSLSERITFGKATMKSNRFDFSYDSPEAFYLQLPVLDYGGWSNVNGRYYAKIIKGPEDLLTLQLPAGQHSIALRFIPPGLMLGGTVTILTTLVILIVGVRFPSKEREDQREA